MIRTFLETPPVPCVVPDEVFDAFGWCDSDVLEWRRPRAELDATTPIDGGDPARMVFVFHAPCDFLPGELARLHAFGLGLEAETALAPYAIDDATDGLFARRVRPRDAMWLAADNLNALFWGLHDWAHFHSHGPFETPLDRAWTELQCDGSALAWLWKNRERAGLSRAAFDGAHRQIVALVRGRFEAIGAPFDDAARARLARLAEASGVPAPPAA